MRDGRTAVSVGDDSTAVPVAVDIGVDDDDDGSILLAENGTMRRFEGRGTPFRPSTLEARIKSAAICRLFDTYVHPIQVLRARVCVHASERIFFSRSRSGSEARHCCAREVGDA